MILFVPSFSNAFARFVRSLVKFLFSSLNFLESLESVRL